LKILLVTAPPTEAGDDTVVYIKAYALWTGIDSGALSAEWHDLYLQALLFQTTVHVAAVVAAVLSCPRSSCTAVLRVACCMSHAVVAFGPLAMAIRQPFYALPHKSLPNTFNVPMPLSLATRLFADRWTNHGDRCAWPHSCCGESRPPQRAVCTGVLT
jgi:hypothetical protein